MANLQRIKDFAEMRKISIRELAERVGLKENQIHVMCRTNSTKIDTLERIAAVLDVHITEFFDGNVSSVHTEGDFSPVSSSGNISVVSGNHLLTEKIKLMQALIDDKDERIRELKERIEELKK